MSNMLGASERTRPIMEYVRQLESTVRRYRSVERKWRFGAFAAGLGAGAVLGFLLRSLILFR